MGSLLPRKLLPPSWMWLLPGTSRLFGPPRRWATVEEYARRTGMETWMAEPAEKIPPPGPRVYGEVDAAYLPTHALTIFPKLVFRLRDAAVYGPDGHIVAPDDTFLWDTAWHLGRDPARNFRDRSVYRRRRARRRRRLPGRTAMLGSDWAIGGFGHFVTDALPRWRLLLARKYTADDFDHFILFHPTAPAVHRLLQAAGLPIDRLVPYDETHDLECAELIGTTFPGAVPALSPASTAWLRSLISAGSPRERVYLTRAGSRRHPANAAEIEQALAEHGVQTLHGDVGTAVLDACANARTIIGVEGANLFNVCFAPPGARVVVLLPGPGVLPYLPWLCQAAGLELAVVAAKPDSLSSAPVFPVAHVRAALDWAMNAPGPPRVAPATGNLAP
jgi:capsular polysaccharide biosynthesis protein